MRRLSARPPLWMIFGITVSGILANTLLTPNIPDVLADLGQTEEMAGRLVAIGPLPGVAMAPIIGILADRYGRRPVLVPCLVVFAVGGAAAATAQTFNWLLAARFLQGLGGAGLINLAVVLIGDHWEGDQRTKLVGRNSAVITGALAVVPFISGALAEVTSWRWSLGLSVVALPVAVVAFRVLSDTAVFPRPSLGDQMRGAADVLRTPTSALILLGAFLLFFVIFGVFLTALPVHLEQEFGLGPGARGAIIGIPAVGSTIAAFNLGRIRARFSIRTVLVASCMAIAVASFSIGLAAAIPFIAIALVLYGLGEGPAIPLLQVVSVSSAPTEQRASALAAWVSAARLGQTSGPLAAAAVFSAYSTSAAMYMGAAIFAVVAILFAVGPLDA